MTENYIKNIIKKLNRLETLLKKTYGEKETFIFRNEISTSLIWSSNDKEIINKLKKRFETGRWENGGWWLEDCNKVWKILKTKKR